MNDLDRVRKILNQIHQLIIKNQVIKQCPSEEARYVVDFTVYTADRGHTINKKKRTTTVRIY